MRGEKQFKEGETINIKTKTLIFIWCLVLNLMSKSIFNLKVIFNSN